MSDLSFERPQSATSFTVEDFVDAEEPQDSFKVAGTDEIEDAINILHIDEANVPQRTESKVAKEEIASRRRGTGHVTDVFLASRAKALKISTTCKRCKARSLTQPPLLSILVWCFECRKTYHQNCWNSAHTNSPGSDSSDDDVATHSKPTPLRDHIWIKNLLSTDESEYELLQKHVSDVYTKWFGVPHNQREPTLLIWPRLNYLFRSYATEGPSSPPTLSADVQFPSLCSFFGETGAGKSTIIKSLLKLQQKRNNIEVPVSGSDKHSHVSTSGDVHLYADSATITGQYPLLYADCEGLRGAGKPIAASLEHLLPGAIRELGTGGELIRALRTHDKTARRAWPLQWQHVLQSNDHEKWRAEVVRNLYPRFLYIFSDIICYVTRNARTARDILTDLVNWANIGFDTTTNQRLRPFLILIINNDDRSNAADWCNVDYATRMVLSQLADSSWFEEQKDLWRSRGKKIATSADLLNCYYDGLRVVSIPSPSNISTRVMLEQYEKLYEEIRYGSLRVQTRRRALGMKATVENLSLYMEIAFEQLAKDFEAPIDFHDLIQQVHDLPQDLSDHFTDALIKYSDARKMLTSELVDDFTKYLASCIALRVIESPDVIRESQFNTSLQQANVAFTKFYNQHWRCEHRVEEGILRSSEENSPLRFSPNVGGETMSTTMLRCVNYQNGHDKGHQFSKSPPGKRSLFRRPLIQVGDFVGKFDTDTHMQKLEESVGKLLERPGVASRHQSLALRLKIGRLKTNTTCLGCLTRRPTYHFSCGHMLCETCIARFGRKEQFEEHVVNLKGCPFGCTQEDVMFRFKPKNAGVRTLALDGGGVRGILELAMLEELEKMVGFGIPLLELFDIVIGTSTGGIIALGLFKQRWTPEECINRFQLMVEEAFEPRLLAKSPVFKHFAQLFYSHRYNSEGIEKALQKAFGSGPERTLFGSQFGTQDSVKVGVTTMSGDAQDKAYLLSNYMREWSWMSMTGTSGVPLDNKFQDYMRREQDMERELLTWEAARATSAAPTYFQEYRHPPTKRTYTDGGMRFNNPVAMTEWERRLVWPEEADRIPDMVISVGAGIEERFVRSHQLGQPWLAMLPHGLRVGVKAVLQITQATLDCERQWSDAINYVAHNPELHARYQRLNVMLKRKPCKLDNVHEVPSLRHEAQQFLEPKHTSSYDHRYKNAFAQLTEIADRLLAALFYFNVTSLGKKPSSIHEWLVHGQLRCRLNPRLRPQFKTLLGGNTRGKAKFRVRSQTGLTTILDLHRREWDMENFSVETHFTIANRHSNVYIEMAFEYEGRWCPISLFPRLLEDPPETPEK